MPTSPPPHRKAGRRMNSRYHAISQVQFQALARGGGGVDAIRQLVAAQHSKHVILLRGGGAGAARRPDDRLAVAGLRAAGRVQRQDPAAAERGDQLPIRGRVGAAHPAGPGGPAVPGAEPGGLAAVAAAAIRAGLDAEIEVR